MEVQYSRIMWYMNGGRYSTTPVGSRGIGMGMYWTTPVESHGKGMVAGTVQLQ